MSYATGSSGSTSLVSQLPVLDKLHPVEWIRSVWDSYVALWPKLLGLEHEAATIAATNPPGSLAHDMAKKVVAGVAEVMKVQTTVQAQVEKYSAELGLGAVVVPALALIFGSIALVILWSFKRYDTLRSIVDGINAGTLTPQEGTTLWNSAGPPPGIPGVPNLGSVGFGALLGIGVVGLGLYYLSRRRRAENPDLVVLGLNPQPDGVWSKRVLQLDYIHDGDKQAYTHAFKPGVRMQALEDGSVRLFNPTRRIWRDFR